MTPATALNQVGGATKPASLGDQHGDANRRRVSNG